jgi:4-amino-4-deoxy-L-arabinose transferase-like glycosyltransferase
LARLPAQALQASGLSSADSWHLINSLMFVLGVSFVYRISRRLAGETAAALGAALFATQPMLWGHAFINPKDIPFMVFFAGTVCFGWRMVDQFAADQQPAGGPGVNRILLPALFLGLATSNRVLGPLAGLLVITYWLARRPSWRTLAWIVLYAALAIGVMFVSWPYLWEDPLNFARVFALMADNPTMLPVLFAGQVYTANALPLRYLPFFLATSITEPVWPLVAVGSIGGLMGTGNRGGRRVLVWLLFAWLLIPVAYVMGLRPPMYDGMRHFLFMLPPGFVLAAAGVDIVARHLRKTWMRAAFAAAVLIPGISGIALLHPYEYTYFNALTGGTRGAFRQYETDYWLTCYKEAVQDLRRSEPEATRLFVHRESAVAAPYAGANMTVEEERGQRQRIGPGDYILVNTRTNEDLRTYRDAPEVLTVGRLGATFCVVKKIP